LPDTDPSSRAAVRQLARSIADSVTREPSQMVEFRKKYCCGGVIRFERYPQAPEVGQALSQLNFGEIAREPLEFGNQIIIPQRVDPSTLPSEVRHDVSFSGPVDTINLLGRVDSATTRDQLRELVAKAQAGLDLDHASAARLSELHEEATRSVVDATVPEERQAALEGLQASLQTLLGPEKYSQYRKLLEAQVEHVMLEMDP